MRARTLLGAAAGVAAVTVASRVVGFGRVAVLSHAVGTSCVGDTYQAANSLPNVVFEVAAGGALASLVVPVLAGSVAAGDRDTASRTASALLTWTVAVLTPFAVAGMLLAPLLMGAFVGSDPRCGAAMTEAGARMLVVFMPQVVLYGVGIVLAGIVQSHHRFLGPALAPLLSSLVVTTAYLLYAAQGPGPLAQLSRTQELTLSVGTTLGVAVLSLGLIIPVRRCGLRLRPTWRFPPGVAGRVRALALAGVAALAAQQVALVVALRLAAHGNEGSIVVFQVATAVFLLPWAVLAVPVATTAFPRLTASAETGADSEYADIAARSVVAVVVAMLGAAVVLIAVADQAARLLVAGVPGPENVTALAGAVNAFAPGLVGYGLLALIGRALYARGRGRAVATATVIGWLTVAVADVALVRGTGLDRVAALGAGNTAGMTVAGVLLVLALHRVAPAALGTCAPTMMAGLAAAAVAVAVVTGLPDGGASVAGSAGAGLLRAVAAAVGFLVVLRLLRPEVLQVLREAGRA